MGVGLAALQRDADGHLVDRAAGQRVRPAERLRAEQDVDAERPALADEAVEQQRRFLRELVVLDEELLELVDDQQDARQSARPAARRGSRRGLARRRRGTGRRARFSSPSSRCSTLRPNSRSLSMATTRACGSSVRRVRLELDALLEVDQVQLDLVRAVVQREVRDQRVQQRRLARAGLAGDEHVLRRALAERERSAAASRRRGRAARRSPSRLSPVQHFVRRRRDELERHLDAARVLGSPRRPRCTICVDRRRRPAARRASAGTARSPGPSRRSAPSFQARCRRRRFQVGQVEARAAAAACVSTLTSV